MVKFEENDYKDWEKFRLATADVITNLEFTLVCQLHAKYYKHTYYKPCTCSPKIVKRWIKDLNLIFDNGR
jgi:hypothetical protein|tara:strand:- start:1533 stop:1742 length:210 start_codon:yes stop_codon:yes gene_type:complete